MHHTGEAHGAINPSELQALGLDPKDITDFSSNCNPYGCPPAAREQLAQLEPTGYPDPNASALKQRLADLNHCPSDAILLGNGAAELIWCLARAYTGPGRAVMQLGPTFGEYRAAAEAVGAEVIDYRLQAPDFTLDVDHFCQHIRKAQPALLFVCQPNNPTGRLLSASALDQIIQATQEAGTHLVLDQAYLWFAGQPPFGNDYPSHVIGLRSLTKDLGLAGLRLGYLHAHPDIITTVKAQQPPWTVNTAAQTCGLAALNSLDWVNDTIARSRQTAAEFFEALKHQGWEVADTDTHFALIRVGDAAQLRRQLLLEHRLQVRDCQSFGLPAYIRVAAQGVGENRGLLEALGRV